MAPPLQFGKYQLVERIALGGMAEIYRAKTYGAAGFEKELVIKRILPQFSADDEFVRMFIDEARLAAKLQHANIVQIYDFDCAETVDGPCYYLAMEWVEGKDVRHLLKEGIRRNLAMTPAMCVHVAVEALKGLHYAHMRTDGGQPLDIVHRDVSPHNLLVSYSGEVKISDFGIAKAAARASVTSNGMVKGKLAYMSPEQVTGQPLDRRTDIYSAGIVLYEMLTRTRLFAGGSDAEIITKVRDAIVPPLRQRNPQVPPDVELVVMRLLAADPRQRYQTAAEAAKALSQTSAYSATEANPLGEYVAQLFPNQPRRSSPPTAQEVKMSNGGQGPKGPGNPPVEQSTVMLDAPSPDALMAARRTQNAPGAPPAAKPVPMAASASGSPPPGAPPAAAPPKSIQEQSTAILDTNSPQLAAVQAQIQQAIASKAAGPPPAAAPPKSIQEQSTAILDTNSPQLAAMQAQIQQALASKAAAPPPAVAPPPSARPAGGGPPPAAGPPPGGPPPGGHYGAPPAAAAPAPQAMAQRTVMLDAATTPAPPPPLLQGGARELAPMAVKKAPATWHRWAIGPGIMLLTAGATFGAARVLLKPGEIDRPPPPIVLPKGKIELKTSPPGAKVVIDGKEHRSLTPTTIEGEVSVDKSYHLEVKLPGYKPHEQELLFHEGVQPLNLVLDKLDERPVERPKKPEKVAAAPPPEDKPEKEEKKERKVSGKGSISIFVHPWAKVSVDGKPLRQTPIANLELPAGSHTFTLENPGLGKLEKVRVNIKPGSNPELRREW